MLRACSGKTSFRFTCSCMVVVSFKHYTFVCIVPACFRYCILFLLNWLVIDLVLQVHVIVILNWVVSHLCIVPATVLLKKKTNYVFLNAY